jgi:hypothetical protein
MKILRPVVAVGFALWALTACEAPTDGNGTTPLSGGVRGLVHYPGANSGALKVALFSSFPPRGAPVATQDITHAVYPQSYQLQGIPAGRYFVLAIVDTDASDGVRFRPTVDPGGAFGGFRTPQSLTVDAVEGASDIDIDLVDPSDSSPWRYR